MWASTYKTMVAVRKIDRFRNYPFPNANQSFQRFRRELTWPTGKVSRNFSSVFEEYKVLMRHISSRASAPPQPTGSPKLGVWVCQVGSRKRRKMITFDLAPRNCTKAPKHDLWTPSTRFFIIFALLFRSAQNLRCIVVGLKTAPNSITSIKNITFSQPSFNVKCMSEVMRICSIKIFHLSKLWKAKFFVLCDVIFLVRLQGKFEIDHSWEFPFTPFHSQFQISRKILHHSIMNLASHRLVRWKMITLPLLTTSLTHLVMH